MCAVAGPHPHTRKHAKQIHVIKFSKTCIYLWIGHLPCCWDKTTDGRKGLFDSQLEGTVHCGRHGGGNMETGVLHPPSRSERIWMPMPVPFILFIQSRTPACPMVKANFLSSVKLSRSLTDMARFCFHGDSKSHKLTATANHPNFVYHCSLVPEGGSDT